MCAIWTAFSWQVIVAGHTYSTARYTKKVTYIDTPGAMAIAFIFLGLTAISMAHISNRLGAPRYVAIAAAAVILGSPIVYFIAR